MCSFCIISTSADTVSLQFWLSVLSPLAVTMKPRSSANSSGVPSGSVCLYSAPQPPPKGTNSLWFQPGSARRSSPGFASTAVR